MTNIAKRAMKDIYKSLHPYYASMDDINSLREENRNRVVGDAYPELYIYGFLPLDAIANDYNVSELELTDNIINEWVDDYMTIRIYSEYDCTGRWFTQRINYHHNPDGSISYVHHLLMDI